jgi:RNA polymerase sigma factor for flagellar operon FliA
MQELSEVYYIASRIRERVPQQVELEDLVSAGMVGVLEAARSFDSSKNVQFKTFANFRIRGAIIDSLRLNDWGSRSVRRKGREIAETSERLVARLGRRPVESEIAEEMHVGINQLHKILAQLDSLQILSQNEAGPYDRSEINDMIESAPDLHNPDPFDLCLEGETRAHLAEAISKLSEREQLILSLHYYEELTTKEVATVLGVTLSRVSQILRKSMVRLRTYLANVESRPSPKALATRFDQYKQVPAVRA